MTEREQVIAELLYLKHDCLEGSATDQTLDKALALLRAQEPRVMTLEEAQSADYCWYESRTANVCILSDATMYAITNGKPKTELRQMGTLFRNFQYDDRYGKDWRCWDKKPTDAQRKATPWLT